MLRSGICLFCRYQAKPIGTVIFTNGVEVDDENQTVIFPFADGKSYEGRLKTWKKGSGHRKSTFTDIHGSVHEVHVSDEETESGKKLVVRMPDGEKYEGWTNGWFPREAWEADWENDFQDWIPGKVQWYHKSAQHDGNLTNAVAQGRQDEPRHTEKLSEATPSKIQ